MYTKFPSLLQHGLTTLKIYKCKYKQTNKQTSVACSPSLLSLTSIPLSLHPLSPSLSPPPKQSSTSSCDLGLRRCCQWSAENPRLLAVCRPRWRRRLAALPPRGASPHPLRLCRCLCLCLCLPPRCLHWGEAPCASTPWRVFPTGIKTTCYH